MLALRHWLLESILRLDGESFQRLSSSKGEKNRKLSLGAAKDLVEKSLFHSSLGCKKGKAFAVH